MKVQSPLQMNNYELQNAVVQNQGGFAEHDWRKGQLQFDSTQNVDKLAVGIDSGQGAEGSKYRYLLDSRANGVSNEMLSGFTGLPLDIESALENRFPSCSAVKTYVNGVLSSAMIYKGTVTPSALQKNAITVEAADYRYAGALDSGTYREKWANGSAILYTSSRFPSAGDSAYTTSSGGTAKTISYVFSKLYADMFIEGGAARSTKPTTKGWVYKVTGSGYFGAIAVEAGDTVICNGGTGGSASDYDLVQANLDLQNLPQLRIVVSGGKSVVIGANDGPTIGFFNAGSDGPTLSLVDSGSYKYLALSCEGDDYDNLKTSGYIDAGTLKEDGTALASKYYLATNPSGFISGITKAMVEAVLTGSISSHSHAYLPLSGGIMFGALRFNNTYGILFAPETTLEDINLTSDKGIRYFHGPSEDFEQYHYPFAYASGYSFGQQNSSLQLAWQRSQNGVGKLCARTSENSLYGNWVSIFHSGNLTPSDYLKKAEGGTLNGDLEIAKASGQADFTLSVGSGSSQKSSTISQAAGGVMTISPADDLEVDGNVKPAEDDSYDLGSSTRKWANVYATAIYEDGDALSDKYAPKATTPKMFRANITGNGSTTTFTLTHNLGTQSPIVQIYEQTSREQVLVDVVANAANTVQVKFGAAPANGKVYNVVIMG